MIDLITIGRIVAPQGLGGEVRVYPLTDFPERFAALTEVYLCPPAPGVRGTTGGIPGERRGEGASPPTTVAASAAVPKLYPVEGARWQGRIVVLKLAGIETRAAAEALRGVELAVPRQQAYPLPEGHYYVFDLLGLPVYTEDGELVGKLKEVLPTGANDVYVVARPGRREALIPAVRAVVREIDLPGGRIVIRPLPGMLEE